MSGDPKVSKSYGSGCLHVQHSYVGEKRTNIFICLCNFFVFPQHLMKNPILDKYSHIIAILGKKNVSLVKNTYDYKVGTWFTCKRVEVFYIRLMIYLVGGGLLFLAMHCPNLSFLPLKFSPKWPKAGFRQKLTQKFNLSLTQVLFKLINLVGYGFLSNIQLK